MKNFLPLFFPMWIGLTLLAAPLLRAQDIAFDSVDPLKPPDDIHLGEVGGVATNSKGDICVYTRTGHPTISIGTARPFAHGGSRLYQFDKTGKFVREIGQGLYGFLVAEQVRVDPKDNIWVVDQMSSMVIEFDPKGRVQMLLGRKDEAERVPAPPPGPGRGGGRGGGLPGAGAQSDVFQKPTDVAWDSAGNIYVADGFGNSRVAKFDKNGKFVKSWGSTGDAQGQFRVPHGLAVDSKDNIYVADSGNKRVQIFDADGNVKSQILNIGSPAAICISPGARQYLYVSNSNPPNDIDSAGEIYKLDLDGKVIGKFGKAGKLMKEFGSVNEIDCRTENQLYVGEIGNWRVQKLTLHAK